MKTVPDFVAPFLWSYDIDKINIDRHKKTIICNVLNYGTKPAIDWLRSTYSKDDILEVIAHTPKSAWSRKSLALWSLVYGVNPEHATRAVP